MNGKPRMIVWFSNGAASAVAAKEAIQRHSELYDVVVVCCDTRPSENDDNYRFSRDVEAWIGQPIVFIQNPKYKTVDEVFEKERYMSGVKGAKCTVELKKKPRFVFAAPDVMHVFGFTADEQPRIRDFKMRNPELRLRWVLDDAGITKKDCYAILECAGIALPAMYRLGFANNNCIGCVKGQSPWYWDMTRTHFPEVFKRRAEQSRALGVRLLKIKGVRMFLDELPPGPYKRPRRTENMSCGPECGIPNLNPSPARAEKA